MPIKVLHVLGNVNLGGAESRIMDIYRDLNKEKVQFDFIIHSHQEGYFAEEIRKMGGHIYQWPKFRIFNYCTYQKEIHDFFNIHSDYKAVHGHMTSTASIYLKIAKKCGVPITIAHARSAGVDKGMKGLVTKVLRIPLAGIADYCFACSALAGEAVFGKRAAMSQTMIRIPNAIDAKRFRFQPEIREQVRKQLGIGHNWVMGHVGRFHYAKNHEFLIAVFAEIVKNDPTAILMLLGEGEGKELVQKQVQALSLEDKVLFLGNQSNVEQYYQAMDCFIFPSRFEGFPGSVLEAQAAGLECLVSDCVTEEVKVTPLVHFISIEQTPEEWATKVQKYKANQRKDMHDMIAQNGFDSKLQVKNYELFYLEEKLEFDRKGK